MRRPLIYVALALCLAMPAASVAQAPAAWHGEYVYEHGAGTGTVIEYRVQTGERLFSLSKRSGAIWTGWGAYSPVENRRPVGRHFRRAG